MGAERTDYNRMIWISIVLPVSAVVYLLSGKACAALCFGFYAGHHNFEVQENNKCKCQVRCGGDRVKTKLDMRASGRLWVHHFWCIVYLAT